MRLQLIFLAILALSANAVAVRAQPAAKTDESARDFSFVVMPIPISNPAVGTGAAVGVLALYKVDGSARPWATVLGGLYTDTQTWGAVVGQKAYLDNDRYRVTAGVGGGVFNTEFFGIGHGAGRRGVSVPIREEGKGAIAKVLVRVAPQVYLGPEFRYVNVRTSLDLANIRFPAQRLQSFELDSTVSALGLAGEYDTRDDEYSPSKGLYGKAVWMRAAESLGSDRGFDRAEASLNGYHALGPKAVLAWRGSVCWTGRGAPFYQLCSYGQQSDLRGYQAGQYIDHAMFAVQAEYRRRLFWRLGAVVFAGVGETADSFSDMNSRDLLPAAGVGLRFQASKTYKVNVRVDYARGRDSDGLYFSIGEAF